MNIKYYIYISILLSSEILPLIPCLIYYRKTKNTKVLFLFLWFLLHFLSDASACLYVELIGINTLPFGVISAFIEMYLILRYAQLSLSWNKYIWLPLYLLPSIVFLAEVIEHGTLHFVSFYLNMTYQSLVIILLLVMIFKPKQSSSELKINQWLLAFHMGIFFYIANLDFLRVNEKLMLLVYPYFLGVIVIFHLSMAIHFYLKLNLKHAH